MENKTDDESAAVVYTKDDIDVVYLSPANKTNYYFDMMNHNVNENLTVYSSLKGLEYFKNPNKISEMFTSFKAFTIGSTTLLIFVVLATFLLFMLSLIICYIIVFIINILPQELQDGPLQEYVKIKMKIPKFYLGLFAMVVIIITLIVIFLYSIKVSGKITETAVIMR